MFNFKYFQISILHEISQMRNIGNSSSVLIIEWEGALDSLHFSFPFSSKISLEDENHAFSVNSRD